MDSNNNNEDFFDFGGYEEVYSVPASRFAKGVFELELIIKMLEKCDGLNQQRKREITEILDRYLRNIKHEVQDPTSQYYLREFMADEGNDDEGGFIDD